MFAIQSCSLSEKFQAPCLSLPQAALLKGDSGQKE